MRNTDFGGLRRTLTLEERFDIDRKISKTWIRYIPEHTPSGAYWRSRFVQYAKDFRKAYANDRENIRMPDYKLNFIDRCYHHSQMVKARKLREAGYTEDMIEDSVGHHLTE